MTRNDWFGRYHEYFLEYIAKTRNIILFMSVTCLFQGEIWAMSVLACKGRNIYTISVVNTTRFAMYEL